MAGNSRQLLLSGGNNYADVTVNGVVLDYKYDATANDSDKSWTVPNHEIWKINWAHVTLVTTATAGNRLLKVYIIDDSSNTVLDDHAGSTQAASLTYDYICMQGIYRETAVVNGELQFPLPIDLWLMPGWQIRFADDNAVDAAADDMTVAFQYQKLIV